MRTRRKTHTSAPIGLLTGRHSSQAMVEFALALPILMALIFGIIEFGLIFQAWLSVENIARQTVRFAVTGEYDPTKCADYDPDTEIGCQGTDYLEQQDEARMETIQEVSKQWQVAIFEETGGDETSRGYLNLTICSNRDTDHSGESDFTFTRPVMGSTTYAACSPADDAGSPGDNVYVFVDFNHPLITPFLSQTWPMIHLVSYRQGIVETFRTSRSIAQPGEGLQPSTNTPTPSSTASSTPLPTETPIPTETPVPSSTPIPTSTETATPVPTFTPSDTPTPSPTPLAIWVDIINPATDGEVINSNTEAPFRAVAWDPNLGTTDGTGISRVVFSFSGPTPISSHQENIVAYCAWGGDAPCAVMPLSTYNSLAPGTYTMYATATAWSGATATDSITFVIPVPPPTSTPTRTFTPTRTLSPTPVTPSRTPTRTLSPTPVTPSNTPTRTLTATPITPTSTRTRTPSPTPVTPSNTPTRTLSPTASRTPTPVTPTNTRTRTPSPTPVTPTKTKTPTPIPPTNTFTPIPPTATDVPPMATNTPVTPISSPTQISIPTATKTPLPTRTPPTPIG